MIKIKLLSNTAFGNKGEIIFVTRNEAHTLIDRGGGTLLYTEEVKRPFPQYRDKMMRGKR